MKKGGYDYSISVLYLLWSTIASVIHILLNTILFNTYPTELGISLLSLIPKTGNLRLPSNYRGIQMQPMIANLYDKIITNRLLKWVKINNEQTAFQKGKSTIDHIFLLRLIIALIKHQKKTLYIGFFDLSEAFDRVSCYLMLKSLIKMGIGSVILEAIKRMYSSTRCVLKCFGKLSEAFKTYTGIRQGASSSVILFIAFMDDIIDVLKEKCVMEPILGDLHCLLHADDTLVLSTNKSLFIDKCNVLLDTFNTKKMSLNFKKSGYMIINGKPDDIRCDLKLLDGWLCYKQKHNYLGSIFTDSGTLNNDVSTFLSMKSKHVNVKLANFMFNNKYAPVVVKLKVVKACINAILTYSCEAWGSCPLNSVEILQRKAIKIALSIQKNIPNEILYTETGLSTLKPIIYKRQWKYFEKIKTGAATNPHSSISRLFNIAMGKNLQFLRHYRKLNETFNSAQECYVFYVNEHNDKCKLTIYQEGTNDPDCCYRPYLKINPSFLSAKFYHENSCLETERLTLTRYRTGSHRLKINTGRHQRIPRQERHCICSDNVQTLEHVMFECRLTEHIRNNYNITTTKLNEVIEDENVANTASLLKSIESVLSIT